MTIEQDVTLDRDELKLVGFTVTESLHNVMESGIVGKLREELSDRIGEIENRFGTGMYLLQIYPRDGHWTPHVPYQHVVGFEVTAFGGLPDGMITHSVPSGRYVKIVHQGVESQIAATYDYINRTYGGRPIDIEYWEDIRALENVEGRIDIYIPAS